jgi:hypothetical protein
MKTRKLPNVLTIALVRYFLNYQLAQKQLLSRTVRWLDGKRTETEEYGPGRPWDKQADLDNISTVCRKIKWGYQACAGSFWLSPPNAKTYHLYIHQGLWPVAEVRPNKTENKA